MLGIRRPTVTLVARFLQKQGLLELNRGSFTIVDRSKMEANACECYETVRQLYTNLYKRYGKSADSQNKAHSAGVQGIIPASNGQREIDNAKRFGK